MTTCTEPHTTAARDCVPLSTGLLYPLMPSSLGAVVPYADLARGHGQRLWFGHSAGIDSLTMMAALAGRGYVIPFGHGVGLAPSWHPHEYAVQVRSVAALSGSSIVAGLGPGGTVFQEKFLGHRIPRPVSYCQEYVHQVKGVLYPTAPPEEVALRRPTRSATQGSVEIGLGVLRVPMARAAGRCAEWAVTWLTPREWLRDTLIPAMAEAAAGAGRAQPRVAAVVHTAVARAARDPRHLAHVSASAHLRAPHYTDMLRRAGLAADPADPVTGAAELVRSGTFVYGTADEIADAYAELHRSGVDEIVLNPHGVHQVHGPAAALDDVGEILDAVARRRHAGPRRTHVHGDALGEVA